MKISSQAPMRPGLSPSLFIALNIQSWALPFVLGDKT